MAKKVYIIIVWNFFISPAEERAIVHNMALSPVTYEQSLRFGIVGDEEQYSFDELREKLKKNHYFKRGIKLYLFVANHETGEKQNFSIINHFS